MTSGLFFNVAGQSHSMRLRVIDQCDDGTAVWEALIDGGSMFFFESPGNSEVWTLFGVAIDRYLEYRGTSELITTKWEVR